MGQVVAVAARIFEGATEQGVVDAVAEIAVALSVAKKWRLSDEVIWAWLSRLRPSICGKFIHINSVVRCLRGVYAMAGLDVVLRQWRELLKGGLGIKNNRTLKT